MHLNLFLAILTGKIVQLGPEAFVVNHGPTNAEFIQYFPTPIGIYKVRMGMN